MDYIVKGLSDVIQFFFELTGSYGWAIIILTVIIRLLLAPLQHLQVKQAAKTRELEPLRKQIEKRFRGDPKRIQEETLRLYRAQKVNPMAGCLPLLVQLPILIAFFSALNNMHYSGVPAFWWIADLSKPDPIILPVLVGITTFVQSKQTTGPSQDDATSQMLLYLMPLLVAWMSTRFAAGLGLYWVVSNLVAILQQLVFPAGRTGKPKPKEAAS